MENRGALRFVVGTLSRQPYQRGQGAKPRHAARGQPRCYGTADSGHHPAAKPDLPLGAPYRRLRSKLGAPKAITAMAHRLARLVYRMLKNGQRYVDKGAEYYEQNYRNQQLQFL